MHGITATKKEERSSCPSPLLNQAGSTSCVAALFNDKNTGNTGTHIVLNQRGCIATKKETCFESYPSNFIHIFEGMGNIDSQMEQSVRRTRLQQTQPVGHARHFHSGRCQLCIISMQKLRLLRVKPTKAQGGCD